MSAITKTDVLVSPEEYLRLEAKAKRKHEYLGGIIHAMAGGRNVHNLIAGNVFGTLFSRLQGKKCDPYNSDTKVRVRMTSGQIRFYYPDVQVICDPNPADETFQDKPVLIVEVTSRSTWRTDHVEKFEAYSNIPSLVWYVLVDSYRCEVRVYQRIGNQFQLLKLTNLDDKILLNSLGIELSLAEIYAGVEQFPVPPEDSDEDE
jgi:Uma2 family endonuclease